MKDGVKQIVGKTIKTVIVATNTRMPKQQVIFVFDDDTSFEFWGEHFSGAGGLDKHDEEQARSYIERAGGEVKAVYESEMNHA